MKQKETIEHEHTVAYTYLQPKGEECAKKKNQKMNGIEFQPKGEEARLTHCYSPTQRGGIQKNMRPIESQPKGEANVLTHCCIANTNGRN